MKLIFLLPLLVYVFSSFALAGEVVEGKGVMAAESKSLACDRAMAMAKKEAVEFLGIKINTEVNMIQSDINGITTQSFDLKVKEQTNAVIKILEKSVNMQFDETTGLITCDIKSKFEITLNNAPKKASPISNQHSEMAQNRIRKILENANSQNNAGEFNSAIFQYKTILDLSTDPKMRRMALDGIVNASLSLRSASPSQVPEESLSIPVSKDLVEAEESPAIPVSKDLVEAEESPAIPVSKDLVEAERDEKPAFNSYVTGSYVSAITGNTIALNIRGKNPKVSLTQEGKKISGTFGKGGLIWGEIEDGNIKFSFQSSGGNAGAGKWAFEPDSKEITGKWSAYWKGQGKWNLTRVE